MCLKSQVVNCLPGKPEVRSSNPSTKREGGRGEGGRNKGRKVRSGEGREREREEIQGLKAVS
jgi:hypothetical protein